MNMFRIQNISNKPIMFQKVRINAGGFADFSQIYDYTKITQFVNSGKVFFCEVANVPEVKKEESNAPKTFAEIKKSKAKETPVVEISAPEIVEDETPVVDGSKSDLFADTEVKEDITASEEKTDETVVENTPTYKTDVKSRKKRSK